MPKPISALLAAAALGCAALTAVAALPTPVVAQAANAPLYRQLMEVNGVARNVRQVIANTRASIIAAAAERKGSALTAAEEARLEVIMTAALDPVTEQMLDAIARGQSAGFSEADIRALIAANTGPAAGRYNAARFADGESQSAAIQAYMVDAVVAIIKTFRDDADSPGVAPVEGADAAESTRIELARRLFEVDGTQAVVEKFVGDTHMRLIIQEVAKYIDFDALSEAERYRLATVAATEQSNLSENILNLNARTQAGLLSRTDLETLIVAFNIPAQQALTRLRLEDDGALDQQVQAMLDAATQQIIADFEGGQ